MGALLILSDVHCRYDLVNAQVEHAERLRKKPVEAIVVVGDLGLYAHALHDFFRRREGRFLRPLFFVEGNHEEFAAFDQLVEEYRVHFTHLPRGEVRTLGEQRCLCLGGARYLDAMNTPRGCLIQDRDIDRCLAHPPGSVDLVLSHDCPRGIGVPNTPGLEHYGPPGFDRGEEIAERFRPRIWVFGHHHQWFRAEVGGTTYQGLPESWRGYGLLDPDGRFEAIEHLLPPEPPAAQEGFWRRWFG